MARAIRTQNGFVTLRKGNMYSGVSTVGMRKGTTVVARLYECGSFNEDPILEGERGVLYSVNANTVKRVCQHCVADMDDSMIFNDKCGSCGKQP